MRLGTLLKGNISGVVIIFIFIGGTKRASFSLFFSPSALFCRLNCRLTRKREGVRVFNKSHCVQIAFVPGTKEQ